MYLPSKYVNLFLDTRGYTFKQVWQVLLPLMAQNNDLVTCRGLVNWLQVASHGTAIVNGQGQPVVGAPVNNIPLVSPAADQDLILHHNLALKLALPGLGQPTEGLEAALFQMASAVVNQTNEQWVA